MFPLKNVARKGLNNKKQPRTQYTGWYVAHNVGNNAHYIDTAAIVLRNSYSYTSA